MRKRKRIIIALVIVAIVIMTLTLAFMLGRNSGNLPHSSQSTAAPHSASIPQGTSSSQKQQTTSNDDSIPYVGPIDSPIIGKWEDHPDFIDAYGLYYEFLSEGTLHVTQFHIEDADYPENWWVNTYNFHFDTWRGQEVLESGFFRGYMHHRVEFYEMDGREAMDIITVKDDGEEYVSYILLRVEE